MVHRSFQPGGDYIDAYEEGAWDEAVEDLGRSDGPSVSNGSRANWFDMNNGYLLGLCLEQVRARHYNGGQMTVEGYQAIAYGYYAYHT